VYRLPNLVALWEFAGPDPTKSQAHFPLQLQEMDGAIEHTQAGAYLKRGQWYQISRANCTHLNIHGPDAEVSVFAWVKRLKQPETYDCETIAGVWDESRKKRQYCLFLDLPIWDSGDQVGGHVSSHGGPTTGYKYCMDAAIGATPIEFDTWVFVGFTYNGTQAGAYLNGQLDLRDGRNPFPYHHGLYDGGTDGADFTVGAVSRSGEPGNFFHGYIHTLAVYNRALSDQEIKQLYQATQTTFFEDLTA
jgi:hypothetical protein